MFDETFQMVTNKFIKEICQEESLKKYLELERGEQSPSEIASGLVTVCCTTMIHTALESAQGKFSKKEEDKFFKIVNEASSAIIPYTKSVTIEDLSVNKERFFKCVEAGIIAFYTYITLNYFD